MKKFEKEFAEIAKYTKGLILAKTAIGWGTASFDGSPMIRTYKGKYGEGYEVRYDTFQSKKNGNLYHHVNYYIKKEETV